MPGGGLSDLVTADWLSHDQKLPIAGIHQELPVTAYWLCWECTLSTEKPFPTDGYVRQIRIKERKRLNKMITRLFWKLNLYCWFPYCKREHLWCWLYNDSTSYRKSGVLITAAKGDKWVTPLWLLYIFHAVINSLKKKKKKAALQNIQKCQYPCMYSRQTRYRVGQYATTIFKEYVQH